MISVQKLIKIMMKLLADCCSMSLGVCIMILIVYNKLSKNTIDIILNDVLSIRFLPYIVCIIIFHLIIIIILCLKLYNKFNSYSNNSLFVEIKKFILECLKYVQNALLAVYNVIFECLSPNYTYYILQWATKFSNNNIYPTVFMILFEMLPKTLILVVFFYEIYTLHLYYYFISLIFLIIPFIFRIIMFILKDVGDHLLPEFQKMLIFEKENISVNAKTNEDPKNMSIITIKLNPIYNDLNLETLLYQFYYPALFNNTAFQTNILGQYNKLILFTNLVYYISSLCGWSYCFLFIYLL